MVRISFFECVPGFKVLMEIVNGWLGWVRERGDKLGYVFIGNGNVSGWRRRRRINKVRYLIFR